MKLIEQEQKYLQEARANWLNATSSLNAALMLIEDLAACNTVVDNPYGSMYCILCLEDIAVSSSTGKQVDEMHDDSCPWRRAKEVVEK